MKKKRFIDKGLKAHKLYAQTPLFKAVLLVAIPGLLISLMSGIYVFADQLLLSILVPKDPNHDFINKILASSANQWEGLPAGTNLKDYLVGILAKADSTYTIADTAQIVKSAVAITLPIMMVINAVPNIAAIGAGSMYGQCIAKNNKEKALQIWKSTFYCAICIGLLSSLLFFSINDSILRLMCGHVPHYSAVDGLTSGEVNDVNQYFKIAYDTQIEWSHQFLDILSWSSILNVFILYFSFMVRAEGKLMFVTVAEMSCNLFNILFDYVYISLCHAGMMGGGLATLTGWSMNVIVYSLYIAYLGRRGQTWMKYKDLLPKHGSNLSITILGPIVIIGLSVFLRNFTNSIANATFLSLLASVAEKSPGADPQYWQGLSGTVWPVGSLFFYAVFGIADGVRTLVAYNYARNKYDRIRRTYWYATFISFVYGIVIYIFLATWLGQLLIDMFPNIDSMKADAIAYMRIQVLFIPMVALSIGGLLMFQATNQMAMANFIAALQGCLTYPLAAGIMYGVSTSLHNPLLFVITNPLNTGLAGIIISIICIVYLRKYLGHIRFKSNINTENERLTVKFSCEANIKKLSYAERELLKSVNSDSQERFVRFKSKVLIDGKFKTIRCVVPASTN